jgi:hypothetical protein
LGQRYGSAFDWIYASGGDLYIGTNPTSGTAPFATAEHCYFGDPVNSWDPSRAGEWYQLEVKFSGIAQDNWLFGVQPPRGVVGLLAYRITGNWNVDCAMIAKPDTSNRAVPYWYYAYSNGSSYTTIKTAHACQSTDLLKMKITVVTPTAGLSDWYLCEYWLNTTPLGSHRLEPYNARDPGSGQKDNIALATNSWQSVWCESSTGATAGIRFEIDYWNYTSSFM